MATIGEEITLRQTWLWSGQIAHDHWQNVAHRRLTQVFEAADVAPFDDTSRFVFFSDLHRGDNGPTDAFARNEALFLRVLNHYYRQGFAYVEVGDGDELWQNRKFSAVRQAHGRVFDLLHQFDQRNRLHLVAGNHDIQGNWHRPVVKDGLVAQEGLILQHAGTGQRLFVVHGHQADFASDRLHVMSRLAVRYIWRRLQLLSFGSASSRASDFRRQWGCFGQCVVDWLQTKLRQIEQRIVIWAQDQHQTIICGHTHRQAFAPHGAPSYFNTGCGVTPGVLTGIEIRDGHIQPVRWSVGEGYQRLATARKLNRIDAWQ
ncbi:MAG: serine/threonine protein phosphatase [Chloroflexota bacterium]